MERTAGSAQADPVVGRWEWRLIQPRLPVPDAELEQLVTGLQRDSAETYLLSPASCHNVKLRGGRLEIKRLQQVHPTGLEQWYPALSADFPLSRGAVRQLNEILALGCFALGGPLPDAATLLRQLPLAVRVVPLVKRRRPLRLEGCPGEWVELQVLGRTMRSLSLEHADPERILAALHSRQLHPDHNTSYPTALLRLAAGVPPMSHTGA